MQRIQPAWSKKIEICKKIEFEADFWTPKLHPNDIRVYVTNYQGEKLSYWTIFAQNSVNDLPRKMLRLRLGALWFLPKDISKNGKGLVSAYNCSQILTQNALNSFMIDYQNIALKDHFGLGAS